MQESDTGWLTSGPIVMTLAQRANWSLDSEKSTILIANCCIDTKVMYYLVVVVVVVEAAETIL